MCVCVRVCVCVREIVCVCVCTDVIRIANGAKWLVETAN